MGMTLLLREKSNEITPATPALVHKVPTFSHIQSMEHIRMWPCDKEPGVWPLTRSPFHAECAPATPVHSSGRR